MHRLNCELKYIGNGVYELISSGVKVAKFDSSEELTKYGITRPYKLLNAMKETMPETIIAEEFEYYEYRRHRPYNRGAHRHTVSVCEKEMRAWIEKALSTIPDEVCDTMFPIANEIVCRINDCKNKRWKAKVTRRDISVLDLSITLMDGEEDISYGGFYIEKITSKKAFMKRIEAAMNDMM